MNKLFPQKTEQLIPQIIFGASHLNNSIWEGDPQKKQIIYLAGKTVVFRQLETNKVRLMKLSQNVEQVHFIGVSPDYKYVIVSQSLINDTSLTLGIYSVEDYSKKLFRILATHQGNYFRLFDFAKNSPNLVLLLSKSNEIYMVDLNKLRHISYIDMKKQDILCMQVCIGDSHLVSISSRDSIKIYRIQEYTLKLLQQIKQLPDHKFTQHLWTSEGLFIGTEQGSVLWICYFNGGYQVHTQLKVGAHVKKMITADSKLITISTDNKILLWQADHKKKGVQYYIIRTWKLPVGRVSALRSLVATSKLLQIVMGFQDNLIGIVDAEEMSSRGPFEQQLQIQYIHKGSHSGGISSIDVCVQRPIVASVSKTDRSVRIWNYKSNRCDLAQYFTDKNDSQIECCAIHPSGYYLALGFVDRLKIEHLLYNSFKTYKQILLKQVQLLKFSEFGSYLCACCAKPSIQVPSWQLILMNSFTLQTLYSFIDWNSPIISVKFSRNDTVLVGMCNAGSLRFCYIGQQTISAKIASRSPKTYTSMAIYDFDDYKGKPTISIFACSPHPKDGSSVIRQHKQVAKKYVQKQYQVKQFNICHLQIFFKHHHKSYRLLAGSVEGKIILYNVPFDGIPLFVINSHHNSISSLLVTFNQEIVISGCKDGIIMGTNIQSTKDVQYTTKGQALDQSLSNIMLVSVAHLIQTQQKNKKLATSITQTEYRSKQLQNEIKNKYEKKLSTLMKQKDEQIIELKQNFKKYFQQSNLYQIKHKDQLNELENRNSLAVTQLQALFQQKIFMQSQQNTKLKLQLTKQQQKYKQQLNLIKNLHSSNMQLLTDEFNSLISKTAKVYKKQSTQQQVFQKGYESKLKIIDQQYENQIQKLIDKHDKDNQRQEQTIVRLYRQIDINKTTIKGLNDTIQLKDKTIFDLRDKIDTFQRLFESKEKQMRELDALLNQKQTFVTESALQVNDMRNKFKQVEKKRTILNVKAAEWKQALQPRQTQIQRLKNKLFELQGELQILVNKEERHINNIQNLEIEKNRLKKLVKEQQGTIKSNKDTHFNLIMDIKMILDKPKDSNRSYFQQLLGLYRKYNLTGQKYLGDNTIEGLGEINRQVIRLERKLDIQARTSKQSISLRKKELTKRSSENTELIKDLNQYKVKFKDQTIQLKSKQKIIQDLMCDLKMSARKKNSVGQRTATKNDQTFGVTRSNSMRVHKIARGSNFQPTLISSYQKDKLVQVTSENQLLRQYILKLQSKQINLKEKITKHLKSCQIKDNGLEQCLIV